jgi:pyrimidine deaminase RibD-like protein
MLEAVEEAAKSRPEDDRPHPLVGSVLADENGAILRRAHWGQVAKMHAECALFEGEGGTGDFSRCTLYVTLEPCTSRGEGKIPCAERVAASGVKNVFIGTLDPNPSITGRGEMYLTYSGVQVNHFDADFRTRLFEMSKGFFDSYRAQHVQVESLYSGGDETKTFLVRTPLLRHDRNGLLSLSLDIISGSIGDVWICAGDLSWLREAMVALLHKACWKKCNALLFAANSQRTRKHLRRRDGIREGLGHRRNRVRAAASSERHNSRAG